jgi:hypothetical protein
MLPKFKQLIEHFGGWTAITAILVLSAQIFLLITLWKSTYHPLPWHDEWDVINFLKQASLNPANLNLWVAQHNEHRLFVPRLVFATDFWVFDGKFLFTFLVSALLALSSIAIFIGESRYLVLANKEKNLLGIALVAMLLCGQQSSNFIWSFQVVWFLVHFFTIAGVGLIVSASRAYTSMRIRYCQALIVLAVFATVAANFSAASGNLSWISTCLAVFLLRDRLPKWTFLAIVLVGFLSVGLYSFGFQLSGIGSGSLKALRADPLLGFTFLLAFLGVPFAPFGKVVAVFAGGIYLIASSLFLFKLLTSRFFAKSPTNAFCLSLLAFVGSVGLVTTAGRFALGVDGALESRFASVVSIGWAALILAIFSLISIALQEGRLIMGGLRATLFPVVIALVYCGVGIGGFLRPPYDYLPIVGLKQLASSALIDGVSNIKALERVGFPDSQNAASSTIRDFLIQTKKSIFSDPYPAPENSGPTINWPIETKIMLNVESPKAVKRLSGLSFEESFGRWSNSKIIIIEFDHSLPRSFQVDFVIGGYGPNIGGKAQVIVGTEELSLRILGGIQNLQVEKLDFVEVGDANFLAIIVPKPTMPSSLDKSLSDQRHLGVVLQSITIRPL